MPVSYAAGYGGDTAVIVQSETENVLLMNIIQCIANFVAHLVGRKTFFNIEHPYTAESTDYLLYLLVSPDYITLLLYAN